MGEIVFLCLVLLIIGAMLFYEPSPIIQTFKCHKDSSKDCPKTISYLQNGGIRCDSLEQCCAVVDQYKAAALAGSMAKPGKNYNGISFSKSYIEQCKNSLERLDKLDTSGGPVKLKEGPTKTDGESTVKTKTVQ